MRQESSPATAYLVDASPYIFRAFHSLPSSMVGPDGSPVGAIYGFGSFLVRLLREERPSHLAVAFDGSLTSSFRNDFYPEYKAHREPPPAELTAQLGGCRSLARALGGTTLVDDRFEADDLIGTLCRRWVEAGRRAVVVTSDKDLAQLVGPKVTLFDFARGERLGPEEVEARFGVEPTRIVDLLALAGDPVDNIPGVRGVGRKTAVALLRAFGTLESLYRRLAEVADLPLRGARSIRDRLEAGREAAFLSQRLARIADDAPIGGAAYELEWTGPDGARLGEVSRAFGFDGLVERATRDLGGSTAR